LKLVLRVKAFPENVPVIFECGPNEGNAPEYRVGISVAANAVAEMTAQPVNSVPVRNI
jgi:hypothetical protein